MLCCNFLFASKFIGLGEDFIPCWAKTEAFVSNENPIHVAILLSFKLKIFNRNYKKSELILHVSLIYFDNLFMIFYDSNKNIYKFH